MIPMQRPGIGLSQPCTQKLLLVSASLDRRSEDVRILPVIVPELELGDIERHIFAAHFVERSYHAALEDRPEAFDSLRVDRTNDILTSRMVNGCVWIILIERIVARILISAEQANSMRHCFANEGGESGGIHIRDYERNNISLAADRTDDWRFAGTNASCSTAPAAFIPMPVLGQPANESFINFDDAAKLLDILHESGSDLVAHEPSGFVGTEAHVAHNLQGAHPLLAGEHQVDDAIPFAKRLVGILKNGIDQDREPIAGGTARSTLRALPMPFARWQVVYCRIATTRAANALWPTPRLQVRFAGIFVRKHRLKLRDGELMKRLWLLAARHGVLPTMEGDYHA
jgi:hypothetical protein